MQKRFCKGEHTITIPALPETDAEERTLCPVRALNYYVARSKGVRSKAKAKKLFVAYAPKHEGDISAKTISKWIKKAVIQAYEVASKCETSLKLHQIRSHEVRALSASLASLGDISVDKILSAASWKSHNTFTSFYLRDLAVEQEGLIKLGPLVASQSVVHL